MVFRGKLAKTVQASLWIHTSLGLSSSAQGGITMASQIVQSLGSVVNTTVSAAAGVLEGATLSSALKATQAPHHLYAGHDWSSLNLLEQWWARWVSGRTCTLMGNFLEMSKCIIGKMQADNRGMLVFFRFNSTCERELGAVSREFPS